jgi:hypothetical protein
MSNKPVRFVTATCACGASFDREVKRGRPQKWCPACVAVPFYDRTAAPAPVAVEGEPVADKPLNQWDDLAHVRDDIEAAMAVVNAEHKVRYADLVARGVDPLEAAESLDQDLRDNINEVYVTYRGR